MKITTTPTRRGALATGTHGTITLSAIGSDARTARRRVWQLLCLAASTTKRVAP